MLHLLCEMSLMHSASRNRLIFQRETLTVKVLGDLARHGA